MKNARIGAFLGVLSCILCFSSCKVENALEPVALAKAVQGLAEGAYLGSSVTARDVLKAHDPKPNPLVGEALYQRYCENCHSIQPIGPKLVGVYNASPNSESDVAIIRYGLKDMKGFRSRLTPFQILDILAYLQEAYYNNHPEEAVSKSDNTQAE